jgi:hypothetical protein
MQHLVYIISDILFLSRIVILTGDFNALENYQGGRYGGYYGGGGYYYDHGINLVIPKFLLLIVFLNFILFLF